MWSAIKAETMIEPLRALSVLISNNPAEANVSIDPINMSSAIRFTRRCSLSVEFGGFTRAQLSEKEARLSITAKLLAGTTSVACE